MARVAEAAEALADAEAATSVRRDVLHFTIREAVAAGWKPADVARVAGVTRARVSQLAPVKKGAQTRVHAQKKGAAPVRVTTADTVAALPDTPTLLSGLASVRTRRPYSRPTEWWDTRKGTALGLVLAHARATGAERVYLIGPPPLDPSTGATMAEQVRAWALGDAGAGWTPGRHYLADPSLPVVRFTHEDGQAVTIMRAAGWWGESDADEATCRAAWAGLDQALGAVPAFAGAGLADSPAVTGRALWLRTIPEGKSYPVLSDEMRELIATTSGQGRIERRPGSGQGEDFTYLDGRFMYAALTWGMPVGEPVRWTGAQLDALDAGTYARTMRGRGRWRITATVPAGWAHVGLLMAPEAGGGRWVYPSAPGQTFTTWADGSEVWVAMEQGWTVVVHEGITWAEGKPLDTWRDALVKVWEKANAAGTPASALAAKAVRSILLYALGAFAGRAHTITRTATPETMPEVPAGTEVRRVGEHLMWEERQAQSGWTASIAHPEWSATVWARARVRLLTGRGVEGQPVGALHLDPSRVVAFATDALYLAGGAPEWADDGNPGRFRTKGTRPGPFTWPSTNAELFRLRDEAEQ